MPRPMLASNDGVVVGVDTHRDIHVAVALSGVGAYLGAISVPTTPSALANSLTWPRRSDRSSRSGSRGPGASGPA